MGGLGDISIKNFNQTEKHDCKVYFWFLNEMIKSKNSGGVQAAGDTKKPLNPKNYSQAHISPQTKNLRKT